MHDAAPGIGETVALDRELRDISAEALDHLGRFRIAERAFGPRRRVMVGKAEG